MAMKYLALRLTGGEGAVVFPSSFQHAWVAGQFAPAQVVGAGFVRMADGRAECFGGSASLGVMSRRETDSRLLAHDLGGGEGPTGGQTG